jgi:hypothetical protein
MDQMQQCFKAICQNGPNVLKECAKVGQMQQCFKVMCQDGRNSIMFSRNVVKTNDVLVE